MYKLLKKFLIILPAVFVCSCINDKYDLNDIDDDGGLRPALVLPIGTLRTEIMNLIAEAGIPNDLLRITDDTISIVYEGSMSLSLLGNLEWLNMVPDGTPINLADYGLPEINLGFDGGREEIEIDVFNELTANGSALYPTNPKVTLNIRNYIGMGIDIDVNEIASHGKDKDTFAVFGNGVNTRSIHVGGATNPNSYNTHSETFDKRNGKLHALFSIAPEKLIYDFDAALQPIDGSFIVKGKYVDIDYEIKIPLTFGKGTKLASADTIDLDLSGEDLVSNLDELKLWIDYENALHTTVDLNILFLDQSNNVIPGIDRTFKINAINAASKETRPSTKQATTGTLLLTFDKSEIDKATETRSIILQTILKVADNDEINIRPSDYISLKLSAYSKVNI